ncbi:DUF3566 domain-containing protein [Actinosynnema sp. NPDC020468]|uniref:DUF3566 domain-containing protein n=1 Tax=Actinosynnema sp. NPDC020468 TaxID=3154488 RepID=UPI0033C782D4
MSSPEKPEGRDADKTAVITKPGADQKKDDTEKPTVSIAEPPSEAAVEADKDKTDHQTAAPPPWQRVTSDAKYAEAQQVGPGDVAPEQPTIAVAQPEQPAYPASDPDTVAVARPVVTGTAAPGAARTSVNLGASAGGGARPAATTRRPGRGPRRASLQVKRVDPWSVLKLALVLGVALFFVWLVAVGVLYGVLNGMGVWDKINNTANDLLQGNEPSGDPLISAGRVFGVAAIIGAVNIVLFTALATVGAFVYNVSADLAGGLEVTLSERE